MFCEESFGKVAPYTFISHRKMSIFFRKGRSSNYTLESQPGKLMLETFSCDNNCRAIRVITKSDFYSIATVP